MKRTRKAATFNLETELQRAFDWLWQENLKQREHDFNGQTYYVTATSLERRLRAAASEQMHGYEYGKLGADAWGHKVMIRTGTRYPLLQVCRDWLLRKARNEGTLEMHNFGKGHVSGERFRPTGQPLSPAEERTLVKKAVPRESKPVHAADPEAKGWPKRTLCSRSARKTARKSGYFGPRRGGHTDTRFTGEYTGPVTCQRCLKLLAEQAAQATDEQMVQLAIESTGIEGIDQ